MKSKWCPNPLQETFDSDSIEAHRNESGLLLHLPKSVSNEYQTPRSHLHPISRILIGKIKETNPVQRRIEYSRTNELAFRSRPHGGWVHMQIPSTKQLSHQCWHFLFVFLLPSFYPWQIYSSHPRPTTTSRLYSLGIRTGITTVKEKQVTERKRERESRPPVHSQQRDSMEKEYELDGTGLSSLHHWTLLKHKSYHFLQTSQHSRSQS